LIVLKRRFKEKIKITLNFPSLIGTHNGELGIHILALFFESEEEHKEVQERLGHENTTTTLNIYE
jgi:site-specific recombinase XerC